MCSQVLDGIKDDLFLSEDEKTSMHGGGGRYNVV
jgi:hypothetical protein